MTRKILISCKNCKYLEELKGGIIGECRLNPPVSHPVLFTIPIDEDKNNIQEMANEPAWWIYPVVKNDVSSWCGKFEPDA